MIDLSLIFLVILGITVEFTLLYYKQRFEAIPIYSIFVPLFLAFKGISDLYLTILLCLLGIIIFILKEFSINFDADQNVKLNNILLKTAFTILIFSITWTFTNFFAKHFTVLIIFFIVYSYFYAITLIGFVNNIVLSDLRRYLLDIFEKSLGDKVSIDNENKNEIFEKLFINVSNESNFLPFRFVFFEYFLLVALLCLWYILCLIVKVFFSDVYSIFSLHSFILVFFSYSMFVYILRFMYNRYNYSFVIQHLRELVDSTLLSYENKTLSKELEKLKEDRDKLVSWLKYLGDFYSNLDDNPDYEDLYNSFYSIVSKSLSFSRFIIFIFERDEVSIDCIKPVFHRGIGRVDLYLKNTCVEVVINSLKPVYYFGGTVFSALALFKDDRSFICSPIKIGNKILGVAYVSSLNTRSFDEKDVNFIQLICDKFAIMYILYKEYSKTLNMAIRDGLTGLYSHRHFQELLSKEIENAKLYGYPVCLLMIDTDKFKQYNDTFGHPMGDELLKSIAKLLTSYVKDKGYVCRYGGDEFAIILPNFYKQDAYLLAEQIREGYKSFRKGDIQISASIGIACFPIDASSKDELIKKSDELLYIAKREGRNRVIVA
ncbi:MAG: sensor domain-containing diguanylate cyclase [Candidatus Calescibacterium sp.]|nr:sensor domain-containing diguanylate cyclase [Candidatus Calescibacterium sp.]MCX7972672.1 sensor domain-containing diguanylate cyclase [bacterium]MDW8194731.1 sensor domain-containing diguanylate cyclase [Candidatus Calescibacterium sp.]